MLTEIFCSSVQLGTSSDRDVLCRLAEHERMGGGVGLVYVYSLGPQEPEIPYPKRPGKVVYVGETKRTDAAGIRFGHHIATDTHRLSTNINHTLSVYYTLGRQLHLRVFAVADGLRTVDLEKALLRSHLNLFGANPLGQGTTGKPNTPYEVNRVYSEQRELHEECAKCFGVAP